MTPSARERGYSLMMVIVTLAFLSALAMITIQSSTTETKVAGNDRATHDALHIAQAGVAWGTSILRAAPFDLNAPGTTVTSVLGNGALGPAITGTGATVLDGWKELPNSPVSYGGGSYRVGIRDDIDDADLNTDSNGLFLMRALGTDKSGNRRLIEVVLSVN